MTVHQQISRSPRAATPLRPKEKALSRALRGDQGRPYVPPGEYALGDILKLVSAALPDLWDETYPHRIGGTGGEPKCVQIVSAWLHDMTKWVNDPAKTVTRITKRPRPDHGHDVVWVVGP